MSEQATIPDLQVIEEEPVGDIHQGRPVDPIYAERGAALMAQWAAEDRT